MLPRQNRLTKMKDFEILFKEGRFVNGALTDLKVWKTDPAKYPKRKYSTDDLLIGFVVGTKISKSAVKRNRAKRQMREVVRLLLKGGKIKNGFMVLVIARPAILEKEYNKIEDSIIGVFKKAGLFREKSNG
jgi:ribonuclease P protein component